MVSFLAGGRAEGTGTGKGRGGAFPGSVGWAVGAGVGAGARIAVALLAEPVEELLGEVVVAAAGEVFAECDAGVRDARAAAALVADGRHR